MKIGYWYLVTLSIFHLEISRIDFNTKQFSKKQFIFLCLGGISLGYIRQFLYWRDICIHIAYTCNFYSNLKSLVLNLKIYNHRTFYSYFLTFLVSYFDKLENDEQPLNILLKFVTFFVSISDRFLISTIKLQSWSMMLISSINSISLNMTSNILLLLKSFTSIK